MSRQPGMLLVLIVLLAASCTPQSVATSAQRGNFEFIGSGLDVHWPDIDEDISATGMLFGIPARPSKARVRPRRGPRPAQKPAAAPA